MELPTLPFFFRIYSDNGQGMIYKALREVGHQTYDCQGSRQSIVDGKIVWVMAEYTDLMPASAISTIIHLDKSKFYEESSDNPKSNVKKAMSKKQKVKLK